jgi:hypothetical protein
VDYGVGAAGVEELGVGGFPVGVTDAELDLRYGQDLFEG